jgi:hypothetical protein
MNPSSVNDFLGGSEEFAWICVMAMIYCSKRRKISKEKRPVGQNLEETSLWLPGALSQKKEPFTIH